MRLPDIGTQFENPEIESRYYISLPSTTVIKIMSVVFSRLDYVRRYYVDIIIQEIYLRNLTRSTG